MDAKTTARSWLWPDHVIHLAESRRIREEHNALVNSHHNLLEACKAALWYYDAFRDKSPVGDTERDDIEAVRAAIAKAEGRD